MKFGLKLSSGAFVRELSHAKLSGHDVVGFCFGVIFVVVDVDVVVDVAVVVGVVVDVDVENCLVVVPVVVVFLGRLFLKLSEPGGFAGCHQDCKAVAWSLGGFLGLMPGALVNQRNDDLGVVFLFLSLLVVCFIV